VRKQRVRSSHPGVVLVSRENPSGGTAWRAIYVDPDTGRKAWVTLDLVALHNADLRRAWAIQKAKSLAKRRMEIESGAPRATGLLLTTAIDRYFDAHKRLSERTREIYRTGADKFEQWAESEGVTTVDEVTRPKLLAFRDHLVATPKRAPKRRGKRGKWTATDRQRSAASVNQELRSVRTVLGYLHDLALLPRLSFDDLRRGLKPVKGGRDAPEFLSFVECGQLLRAALAHDADMFTETRDEHVGEGRRSIGTTPRHDPIAPFVATVLLTGMRLGEALALQRAYLHLDTLDADDRVVGEIRLPSTATKTRRGRTVSLDVCPMLRELLAALVANAGDSQFVFGDGVAMTTDTAQAVRKRLVKAYGAPSRFSWQLLRSTCATISSNAPSLWGSASAFVSAQRLGHDPTTASKFYTGQVAVSKKAKTLEAAMSVESEMLQIVAAAEGNAAPEQPARPAREVQRKAQLVLAVSNR
jgi:integrase